MSFESFEPCTACGNEASQRCYHHLYTQKAYPKLSDKSWNKISVCLKCHNDFHNKGTDYMANKYKSIKEWLLNNDWFRTLGSWRHEAY